jgi:hypothetical protein
LDIMIGGAGERLVWPCIRWERAEKPIAIPKGMRGQAPPPLFGKTALSVARLRSAREKAPAAERQAKSARQKPLCRHPPGKRG